MTRRLVSRPPSFVAYGVDGCPEGWLYVALLPSGQICWGVVEALDELVARATDFDRIFVDIPIGLPNGPGQRQCDICARRKLGPLRSTVFPAPVREVFCAISFAEAQHISHAVAKKGISKQSFAISGKIAQVDSLLRRCPRARKLIREVHPEICFWALNGGKPMKGTKKRKRGFGERVNVLKAV